MTTSHATADDWATYIGTAAPASLTALLRRATLDVNRALVSAVYDDTDTDMLAALAEATCEQADALRASGTSDGNPNPYQSVSAGSIRLARAASGKSGTSQGSDGTELSPRAWQILCDAGLTGGAPSIGME
jgi:hypothetical protein